VIRFLSGQVSDLPPGLLDSLPPRLATGPLSHDTLATTALSGSQGLGIAAADSGRCWINGTGHDCLILRHVALRPDVPPDTAIGLVHHLLQTSSPTLCWAPAGVEHAPLGFWRFVNGVRLRFPPGKPALTATAGLRPLVADDRPALYALFTRRAQALNGPGCLTEADWLRRSAPGDGGWIGFEQDGRLTGALGVRFDRRDGSVRAIVTSLMDDIAHLCETCTDVIVDTLPPDRPSVEVGDIVSKQHADRDRSWTVRAGQPDAWLSAVAYAGDGEIRLGIRDPLGLWPHAVALRWQDGKLADWSATTTADLQIRIEALMGLSSGQLTPDHLVYRDWVGGPSETFGSLSTIWAPQPLHRFGWDRP
jgi:hypothetical protein